MMRRCAQFSLSDQQPSLPEGLHTFSVTEPTRQRHFPVSREGENPHITEVGISRYLPHTYRHDRHMVLFHFAGSMAIGDRGQGTCSRDATRTRLTSLPIG